MISTNTNIVNTFMEKNGKDTTNENASMACSNVRLWKLDTQKNEKTRLDAFEIQELIRRWDSECELFYDDIAHVLQNTKKRTYFV